MGKAAAREKRQLRIEAIRAQQAREARRKVTLSVTAVGVVLVVIVALIVVKIVTNGHTTTAKPTNPNLASAAIMTALATVPAATANSIGVGTVTSKPLAISAPALTADSKVRILYDGAEYCPFCAGERWAVAVALSRFGTWSNLGVTTSSATDTYPNTATLAFHGATYTSTLLSFTGYEETTNQPQGNSYVPLDTLTAADQAIVSKYDAVPYVSSSSAGTIPFVDIGGKYVISGASYDVSILQGKTHEQIAAALKDPSSDIAKAIIGTANVITADICKATGNLPVTVCTLPGVVAASS
jgi:Domain of unknown function (DUF929)